MRQDVRGTTSIEGDIVQTFEIRSIFTIRNEEVLGPLGGDVDLPGLLMRNPAAWVVVDGGAVFYVRAALLAQGRRFMDLVTEFQGEATTP